MAMLLSCLAFAATGCGEKTFEADEFVEAVEKEGVELELGESFATEEQGKDLYGLELKPLSATGLPAEDQDHTAGSLAVYDDVDGAENGYAECESAADLLCYRAANVVVIVQGNTTEAQRLAAAIRELEAD